MMDLPKLNAVIGVLMIVFIISVTGVSENNAASCGTKPPATPLLKVHIFNYTNTERFLAGLDDRLHVEDIGPYVFRETVEKVGMVYDNNTTISFREKRTVQFLPELSNGTKNDWIVVPNVPMFTVANQVDTIITSIMVKYLLRAYDALPFRVLQVQSFLWGYEDKLLSLLRSSSVGSDVYGILQTRNGTSSDKFTIVYDKESPSKLDVLKYLNGQPVLRVWDLEECEGVNGTDESPHRNQTLNIFISSLCRKLPLVYSEKVTVFDGMLARRYKIPPSAFADSQCCHLDSGTCPSSQLLNISSCLKGSSHFPSKGPPIFASFPHFYAGDKQLINSLDGLQPNEKLHQSYADVHPQQAIVIDGAFRFQLNARVHKRYSIDVLDKFQDGQYLPLIWLEVIPGEITGEVGHPIPFSSNARQRILRYDSLVFCWSKSKCTSILHSDDESDDDFSTTVDRLCPNQASEPLTNAHEGVDPVLSNLVPTAIACNM